MKKRRGRDDTRELCSGLGKLTDAFATSKKEYNGQNISESDISILKTDLDPVIEMPLGSE